MSNTRDIKITDITGRIVYTNQIVNENMPASKALAFCSEKKITSLRFLIGLHLYAYIPKILTGARAWCSEEASYEAYPQGSEIKTGFVLFRLFFSG